jgi:site-specific recombinase XerD
VESVRPLDIARFLGRRRLKQNSRAAYFGYIHSFYRWWGDNGGTNTRAKLPRPTKAPKGVPRPITDEQLRNQFAVQDAPAHPRDDPGRCVRRAACARDRQDPRRGRRPDGADTAGNRQGQRDGGAAAHPVLVEAARGMPRRGWWFPANSRRAGLPIRSRGVADITGQAMDRAGIPGGTAHRIRHCYGSKLVADVADLRTAQTLLRHANLNTTAVYVQVSDPKRVEAIDRLDPFGSSSTRSGHLGTEIAAADTPALA